MTAAENSAGSSFVLLRVGRNRFALPARLVAELAPPVQLHLFPHTSPRISGVIVRRGHIVPVYDAASELAGANSVVHRFYLIARRDRGKAKEFAAIPVDGECELATGQTQPAMAERPSYISGTLVTAQESLDVLDLEALVASFSVEKNGVSHSGMQP